MTDGRQPRSQYLRNLEAYKLGSQKTALGLIFSKAEVSVLNAWKTSEERI